MSSEDSGDGGSAVAAASSTNDCHEHKSTVETHPVAEIPVPLERLLFRAKLCEQTECYDKLLEVGFEIVQTATEELDRETVSTVVASFKNAVAKLRSSWRALTVPEGSVDAEAKLEYRDRAVVPELKSLLRRVLDSTATINKLATTTEGRLFAMKLRADYLRYLAELQERVIDPVMDDLGVEIVELYLGAHELASRSLAPTDPLRLGVALNFAVFYVDICANAERAIQYAKMAFDAAVAELDTLNADDYRESTLLLQLIRDNITLWTTRMKD